MAVTDSDIVGLLTPGLQAAFFDTFTEAGSQHAQIATLIPSNKDTEHYAWLGALPGVQEFLDERKVGNFSEYDYAIKNKTWESTISVDRATLEDDLYGQIGMKAKQMGMSARQHLDILTFGLLASGFTANCFDGAPFFGNHTQGGIVQSNTFSEGLTATGLQDAITAMMRFKDDQGRPMGIMPNLLVVPPELYWEATILLNSAFYPDTLVTASQDLGMNPLKGLLNLVASPYLSNPSNWFLFDTKRAVKAIILQMRKDFEFEALEQNSETGFMRDVFYYGVRARYNVGFGDWRAAFGSSS